MLSICLLPSDVLSAYTPTSNEYGCIAKGQFAGFVQPPSLNLSQPSVQSISECHPLGTLKLDTDKKCQCKLGWTGHYCDFLLEVTGPVDAPPPYTLDRDIGFPLGKGSAIFNSSPDYPVRLRWAVVENGQYRVLDHYPVEKSTLSSERQANNAIYSDIGALDLIVHPLYTQFQIVYPPESLFSGESTCLTLLAFEVGPNFLNLPSSAQTQRNYQPIAQLTVLSHKKANSLQSSPNQIVSGCMGFIYYQGTIPICECDFSQYKFGPGCQLQITKLPVFNKPHLGLDEITFEITSTIPEDVLKSIKINSLDPSFVPIQPVTTDPSYRIYTFKFPLYHIFQAKNDKLFDFKVSAQIQLTNSIVSYFLLPSLSTVWYRPHSNPKACVDESTASIDPTSGSCICTAFFTGDICQYEIERTSQTILTNYLGPFIPSSYVYETSNVMYPSDVVFYRLTDTLREYNADDEPSVPSDISAILGSPSGPISLTSIGGEVIENKFLFYFVVTVPPVDQNSLDVDISSSFTVTFISSLSSHQTVSTVNYQSLCGTTAIKPKQATKDRVAGCAYFGPICLPGFIGRDCQIATHITSYNPNVPLFFGGPIKLVSQSSDPPTASFELLTNDLRFSSTFAASDNQMLEDVTDATFPFDFPVKDRSKYFILVAQYTFSSYKVNYPLGVHKLASKNDIPNLPSSIIRQELCYPPGTLAVDMRGILLESSPPQFYCLCKPDYYGPLCQTQMLSFQHFISGPDDPNYCSLVFLTPSEYSLPISMSTIDATFTLLLSEPIITSDSLSSYQSLLLKFSDGNSAMISLPNQYGNSAIWEIKTLALSQNCGYGLPSIQDTSQCKCKQPFIGPKCDIYISVLPYIDRKPYNFDPLSMQLNRGDSLYILWGSITPQVQYPTWLDSVSIDIIYGSHTLAQISFSPKDGRNVIEWIVPDSFFNTRVQNPNIQFAVYTTEPSVPSLYPRQSLWVTAEFPLKYSDCDLTAANLNIQCPINTMCDPSRTTLNEACPAVCKKGLVSTTQTFSCQKTFQLTNLEDNGVEPLPIAHNNPFIFFHDLGRIDQGTFSATLAISQSNIPVNLTPNGDFLEVDVDPMYEVVSSTIYKAGTLIVTWTDLNDNSFEVYSRSVDVYENLCFLIDKDPNPGHKFGFKCHPTNTLTCRMVTSIVPDQDLTCICKPGFTGPTCRVQLTPLLPIPNNFELYQNQPVHFTSQHSSPILGNDESNALSISLSTPAFTLGPITTPMTVSFPVSAGSFILGKASVGIQSVFTGGLTSLSTYAVLECTSADLTTLGCPPAISTTCFPPSGTSQPSKCICNLDATFTGNQCQTPFQNNYISTESFQTPPIQYHQTVKDLIDFTNVDTFHVDEIIAFNTLPLFPNAQFYVFQPGMTPSQDVQLDSTNSALTYRIKPSNVVKADPTEPDIIQIWTVLNPNTDPFHTTKFLEGKTLPKCEWYARHIKPGSLPCFLPNTLSCDFLVDVVDMCTCKPSHIDYRAKVEIFYSGQYCQHTIKLPLGPFYDTQTVQLSVVSEPNYPVYTPPATIRLGDSLDLDLSIVFRSATFIVASIELPPLPTQQVIKKGLDLLSEAEMNMMKTFHFELDNTIKSSQFAIAEPCYWTQLVKYSTMCATDLDDNGQFIALTGCINPETKQIQCMCRPGYNLNECRYHATWKTPPVNTQGDIYSGQHLELEFEWIGEKFDFGYLGTLPELAKIEFPSGNLQAPPLKERVSPEIPTHLTVDLSNTSQIYISPYFPEYFPLLRLSESIRELSFDYSSLDIEPRLDIRPLKTDIGINELWGLECPWGITKMGCQCPEFVFLPDCTAHLKFLPYTVFDRPFFDYIFGDMVFVYELTQIPTNVKKTVPNKPQTWKFPTKFHFEFDNVRLQPGPIANSIILPKLYQHSSNFIFDIVLIVDDVDQNGRSPYPSTYPLQNFLFMDYQTSRGAKSVNFFNDLFYSPAESLPPISVICKTGYYSQPPSGILCESRLKHQNRVSIPSRIAENITIDFDYFEYNHSTPGLEFYLIAEKVGYKPSLQKLNLVSKQFVLPTPLLDFDSDLTQRSYSLVMSDPTTSKIIGEPITFQFECQFSPLTCIPTLEVTPISSTPPQIINFSSAAFPDSTTTPITETMFGSQVKITIPTFSSLSIGTKIFISVKTFPPTGQNTYSSVPLTLSTVSYIIKDKTILTDTVTIALPATLAANKVFLTMRFPATPTNLTPVIISTGLFTTLSSCYNTCQNQGVCSPSSHKCICPSGFDGELCSNPIPIIEPSCQLCDKTHTESCSGNNNCVCKAGFGGLYCSVPKVCEALSNAQCNSPYGFLKPNESQSDCTTECQCLSHWVGSACQTCAMQCQNNGQRYKQCDKCGCMAGFTGEFCQCKSVNGYIMINGYNAVLEQFFSLLNQLGLNISSKLPSYFDEFVSFHSSLQEEVRQALAEMMEIDTTSVVLKVGKDMTKEANTTFGLTFTYSCDIANPTVDTDGMSKKWSTMLGKLLTNEVILKYFTFEKDATIVEKPDLTPIDDTLPSGDDKFEENVALLPQISFIYYFCFLYGIVFLIGF
jgi:hypothetical protein